MDGENRGRILVVDDDALLRSLITRLLTELGVTQVLLATTASEALELLDVVRPAAVLCDIRMETPLAGFDVARAARSRNIAIALISGDPPPLPLDLADVAVCNKGNLCVEVLGRLLASLVTPRP